MIKVNLLRDQTVRTRRTGVVRPPTVSSMGFMLLGLFLALVGGLGAWWYTVHAQISALTATRDRLQIENTRLEGLRKEMNEFEKLKQLRESRIQVIEKLKENQTGPVSLLSRVIQGMPREFALWLTFLEQKGDRVQIKGYAPRGEAIPEFMSNLAAGGFFKTVDLELMEEEKDAAKFSLICTTARKVSIE